MYDWRDTFAGVFGSLACVYVGQPFDTVKTRLQTRPEAYRGVVDCFVVTTRREGVLSLWKGATPAVVSAVTENAVLFTVNGVVQRLWASAMHKATENLFVWENLVIGGICGVFSSTAICAPEVIKCRLQVQGASLAASSGGGVAKYAGPMDCALQVVRHEGPTALLKGLPALLARDIPFNSLFFGCYDAYCKLLCSLPLPWRSNSAKSDLSGPEFALAGGLAGSSAWAVVFPADVLKSRMQVSSLKLSFSALASQLYRAHGVRVFYNGVGAAVARAFPANGALFCGVELAKRALYPPAPTE